MQINVISFWSKWEIMNLMRSLTQVCHKDIFPQKYCTLYTSHMNFNWWSCKIRNVEYFSWTFWRTIERNENKIIRNVLNKVCINSFSQKIDVLQDDAYYQIEIIFQSEAKMMIINFMRTLLWKYKKIYLLFKIRTKKKQKW